MATENDNAGSSDFYESINKTLDENKVKLNEMMDKVLKMRAAISMQQLEISSLYNPKNMQEFNEVIDKEEYSNKLKRYTDMFQELRDLPPVEPGEVGDLPPVEPMYKPVHNLDEEPEENRPNN